MNMKEQESGKVNTKSGKVVAKSKRLPKGHADYWKDKVKKLTYKKDGELIDATNYSVRLQSLGRREFFNLNTANKSTAAQEAKKIHAYLISNGWGATLAKFKPEAEAKAEIETVGDLIAKAYKEAEVRPLTLRQYIGALRRIVGAIKGIKSDDVSKYKPGGSEWQQRVDKVKLAYSIKFTTLHLIPLFLGHSDQLTNASYEHERTRKWQSEYEKWQSSG